MGCKWRKSQHDEPCCVNSLISDHFGKHNKSLFLFASLVAMIVNQVGENSSLCPGQELHKFMRANVYCTVNNSLTSVLFSMENAAGGIRSRIVIT